MGWDGPMTYRQFKVWQAWLREEWNTPTRSDYYLMEIACEVRRVLSSKPGNIKVEHFKLEWVTGSQEKELTPEQLDQFSDWVLAIWAGRFGMPIQGLPEHLQPINDQLALTHQRQLALTNGNGNRT
jgi:hypothetical protein